MLVSLSVEFLFDAGIGVSRSANVKCCYKQLEELIGDEISVTDIFYRYVSRAGIDVLGNDEYGISVCAELLPKAEV